MWIILGIIAIFLIWNILKKTSSAKVENLTDRELPKSPRHTTALQKVFLTHIAGIPYRLGKEINISTVLNIGDKLIPKREPGNPWDTFAIKLYKKNLFIGYIPKKDNFNIANHLDSGLIAEVEIDSIDPSDLWGGVKIVIRLL